MLLATEGLVARLSAMDPNDPEVQAINPYIDAFTTSMVEFGVVAPRWEPMNDVLLRIAAALNAATTQTKSPAQALQDAQSEIVELVKGG
jgi:maltose-binding protein MalE